MTFKAFKALAVTACSAVLAFFQCIGSAALLAAAVYEGVLAGIAAKYASSGKNFNYTCYGFGKISIYTVVSA